MDPAPAIPRAAARWRLAVAAVVLTAVPAAVAPYPPITDLPQQLAQIPLLGDALDGARPELTTRWLAPNKLSYPLLGAAWAALPPRPAARLAAALVAAAWVLSLHWLAARRGRSAAAATLAGVLTFNHAFYLGLFNFVVGLAAFAFWFVELAADPEPAGGRRPAWRTALGTAAGSLALYFAHALWLAAGLVWLAAAWLIRRPPPGRLAAHAVGLVPALALVAAWYPSLGGEGWRSISSYGPASLSRLLPATLTNWTLGGITGWLEPVAMLAVLTWLAVALWQHRGRLRQAVDLELVAAAVLFLLAALTLPDKVDRTLRFASRWMPVGWALVVVALPPPAVRGPLRRAGALAVLALFCLTTAVTWRAYGRQELAGLDASLAALPTGSAVLGLDYVRHSPRFKQPAYMHLPAYAQLLGGSRLGFSFTSLASSLVVRRDLARPDPWTPGLEWAPQLLRDTDLDHFDYLLLHAPAPLAAGLMEQESRLEPVTGEAPWRLFHIADRAGRAPEPAAER